MLLNSGRKVEIWFWIFLFSCIIWVLVDIFRSFNTFWRIVTKVDIKMRYGIIIRAVSQSYVSMVLSTRLNVYTISWSGQDVSMISNLIALGGSIIMLYIPTNTFNIIYKTSDLNNPEFQKRYKTFIVDLKTSSPYWYQFITVFLFRRALYAWGFVIISGRPNVQIWFILFTVVGMIVYLALIRPYKFYLSILLSLVNEVLLLKMIAVCFRFTNPTITRNLSSQIGKILIIVLISTIVFNWICIVIYQTMAFLKSRIKNNKERHARPIKENSSTTRLRIDVDNA